MWSDKAAGSLASSCTDCPMGINGIADGASTLRALPLLFSAERGHLSLAAELVVEECKKVEQSVIFRHKCQWLLRQECLPHR